MPIHNTQAIRDHLDIWNDQILQELKEDFTANDYLNRLMEIDRSGFRRCLRNADNDSKVFNSWFARWYLIGLEKRGLIERANERRRTIISVNNHQSRNVVWRIT